MLTQPALIVLLPTLHFMCVQDDPLVHSTELDVESELGVELELDVESELGVELVLDDEPELGVELLLDDEPELGVELVLDDEPDDEPELDEPDDEPDDESELDEPDDEPDDEPEFDDELEVNGLTIDFFVSSTVLFIFLFMFLKKDENPSIFFPIKNKRKIDAAKARKIQKIFFFFIQKKIFFFI